MSCVRVEVITGFNIIEVESFLQAQQTSGQRNVGQQKWEDFKADYEDV